MCVCIETLPLIQFSLWPAHLNTDRNHRLPSGVSRFTQNHVWRVGWGVVMEEQQERTLQVSSIPLASLWCTAPPHRPTHTHRWETSLPVSSRHPPPSHCLSSSSSSSSSFAHLTPSVSHHPSHKTSTDGPSNNTHTHTHTVSVLASTATNTHRQSHQQHTHIHKGSRLSLLHSQGWPDTHTHTLTTALSLTLSLLLTHTHTLHPTFTHTHTDTLHPTNSFICGCKRLRNQKPPRLRGNPIRTQLAAIRSTWETTPRARAGKTKRHTGSGSGGGGSVWMKTTTRSLPAVLKGCR